ncbi:MAG: protein phosphatase 2C domain-containing protein [bacterium]|nr:protein phosphatase 2C domain-containing protein [bacterium]
MRLISYTYDSVKSPSHDNNEDEVLIIKSDKYALYFLFDGVGSAVHSLDAVRISSNFISKNYRNYEQGDKFNLSKLMYDAHLRVISSKLPEAFSTYVAMFIPYQDDQKISISSMGDSRIYGLSKQYIVQYTEDDSVLGMKNTITKSLGMLSLNEMDFGQNNFVPKESRYLVSSDGFYNLMEKNIQSYYKTLSFSKLDNVKKSLRRDIVENNTDDASYVLIEIHV